MARSSAFDAVVRAARVGRFAAEEGISGREALARIAESRERRVRMEGALPSRRAFLKGVGAAAAVGGAMMLPGAGRAAPRPPVVDVGIVGGGLAGLSCADRLAGAGIAATIYEGRTRTGGRQWSMGGAFAGPVSFPGQVVERGGELIDTTHLTMKGFAKRFGLQLEDVTKQWLPGHERFYVGGQVVSEEQIVDEFRALVDAMRPDLASMSAEVTFDSHTAFDEAMDRTSLAQYLYDLGAAPALTAVLDTTYTIEYGFEIDDQTCLALLFFMHIDKRSRFQPFGVFSDERYHVIGGNEQIAKGLRDGLPGQINLGHKLTEIRKRSDGRLQLTFSTPGGTVVRVHDAVVLAIPPTMVREVSLHPSLGITSDKQYVIDNTLLGFNAKLNVGFKGRYWGAYGNDGVTTSDLPNHQNTWEPNPSKATATDAVLLDYSGGDRARSLDPSKTDTETARWLGDLERIMPGAQAAVKRVGKSGYLSHLQHWPSDPLIRGAYTANQPGYFTTIAGREGTPVGNLFFAGEHTDSFYEWQGFMEGACNSGIRAADELLGVY